MICFFTQGLQKLLRQIPVNYINSTLKWTFNTSQMLFCWEKWRQFSKCQGDLNCGKLESVVLWSVLSSGCWFGEDFKTIISH